MAKKRGRKRVNALYFGPEQEEAVLRFLETEDEYERNIIYNKWLREPLNKMIESIIRKYKLYRKGETFEDLHADTLSFLMTKADKFNPHKKTKTNKTPKAYSYYGTICKNYILGLLINDEKRIKRMHSYEDITSELEKKEEFQHEIDDKDYTTNHFINKLIAGVKQELTGEALSKKKKLTENEEKIGLALIDILGDWERTLGVMDGGNKFNKNTVLASMRNYTNLSTKDIRISMKRYKILYNIIKLDTLENGIP
tara:strand:- start:1508 stop:2269 length:762 start_codon:yes stop_codon:yes gene_type:complete